MATNKMNVDESCRQFHYLYAVELCEKRILRPESMRLVIGRSKCADLVISLAEVSRKQCEIICSGGDWYLHNLDRKGTYVVGKKIVKTVDLKLQSEDIFKIAGVFIQFKFEVVPGELPMRLLKIIVLIGDQHCCLAAESRDMPEESDGWIVPKAMKHSGVEISPGDSQEKEELEAKDDIIKDLISENRFVMQELAEIKSALIKALTEKSETELKEAKVAEQLKIIEENPFLGGDFGETIENELLCSVCNDILVDAVTLNCSHTFCAHCLGEWKKKNRICPLCRSSIRHECKSRVVDSLIEKLIGHLPEDTQKRRKELIEARKASKKRGRNRSSGRQKRKRLAIIELGDPVNDVHEVVRISVNYSNEANETIEIISSDDDIF